MTPFFAHGLRYVILSMGVLLGTWSWASPAETELRLLFVGDIMLDGLPGERIAAGVDPFADFAPLFSQADVVVGNLECPIATSGKAIDKLITFRAHPRVLPLLARYFNALSLANNHVGDYGKEAMGETLSRLEEAKIPYFGAGHDLAQAHRPLIIERQGIRIALLAYDLFKPRSFEAQSDAPGVAWGEVQQIQADIHNARLREKADLVIPFLHWGWEQEENPSPQQRALAQIIIDAGATLVIGNHPHITQGAAWWRGKPIIYSLGNFVFDGFNTEASRTGWLLQLTVNSRGVVRWHTLAARQDDEGIPHPMPTAHTPCGNIEANGIGLCNNESSLPSP